MSIEPEFRVLLAYLLVMRWGVGKYFGGSSEIHFTLKSDRYTRTATKLVWVTALIPAALFVVMPSTIVLQFGLLSPIRWLAAIPAVSAILFVLWSMHLGSGPDEFAAADQHIRELFEKSPYRYVRHPVELGDTVFLLSLATISDRVLIWLFTLAAISVQFCAVIPRLDAALKELLGDEFVNLPRQGGRFLPRLPMLKAARYQVPSRFGLQAIIALVTLLSLLFGTLNFAKHYIEVPPTVYFFVAGEVLVICIAQMYFGRTPRLISVLVGTVLLPTFIAISLQVSPARTRPPELVVLMVLGTILGGLIGYCIGALAAGFFLIMEWVEPWFSPVRSSQTSTNVDQMGDDSQKHEDE